MERRYHNNLQQYTTFSVLETLTIFYVLQVAPEGLTLLARKAVSDISHLLRPGHLAQLRKISYLNSRIIIVYYCFYYTWTFILFLYLFCFMFYQTYINNWFY